MNKVIIILLFYCCIASGALIIKKSNIRQILKPAMINYSNTVNDNDELYRSYSEYDTDRGWITAMDYFPRKKKHSLLLLMGGLQSLVTFFIIKIKLIFLAASVVGVTLFVIKLLGYFNYSNYIYKSQYPEMKEPIIYGYPPVYDYPKPEELSDWSSNLHHSNNHFKETKRQRRRR